MKALVHVEAPVIQSARVKQVSSMFDVPPSEKESRDWDANLPLDEQEWSLGLIVGPSGAGKSTVTRAFWPHFEEAHQWDPAKAVIDCFPRDISIKEIVGSLTAVGFGSPPSWLRPYQTLSTGERFRADVAYAIASATEGQPVVIDEYTSTVDRQVAQIASHAVQKTIRRSGKQLIAVTCHYDVLDWLQPDWVYQPHLGEFTWRCLQPRPSVDLQIYPVDRSVWDVFRRHHYLSGSLHPGAHCVGGFVDGQIVAFSSWIRFPHPTAKNIMKGHRLVIEVDHVHLFVLADACVVHDLAADRDRADIVEVGVGDDGIGGRMDDWTGQYLYEQGERYHNTVAHPAMIAYYKRSPRWKLEGSMHGRTHKGDRDLAKRAGVLGSAKGRRTRGIAAHDLSRPAPALQTGPKSTRKKANLDPRLLQLSTFSYVPPKVAA